MLSNCFLIFFKINYYIPGTQMTLVMIGKGILLEGPSKIDVIWATKTKVGWNPFRKPNLQHPKIAFPMMLRFRK